MTQNKKGQIALLKRIALAGVPIEPSGNAELVPRHLLIEQVGDFMVNRIIDIVDGGALYQASVRITCISGPLYFTDLALTAAWDETITLLSDPANKSGRRYYQLRNGDSFERHSCVNHKLLSSKPLRPGDFIEGILLAESMRQVPSSFHGNCQLKVLLSFFDQFANEYSTELVLALERNKLPEAHSRAVGRTHRNRNSGLFAPRETAIRAGGIKRVDNDVQETGTDDDAALLQ